MCRHKMHVKSGDTIKIISGKDKGKVSQILQVFPKTSMIIAKDVNLKTKHYQPKQKGESGEIRRCEAPIHSSNVMLYSIKEKVSSRFTIQIDTNNKKQRVLKKNNETIEGR
uniref:Large ribosomal subunit protein uL24c n=1 Tax=Rhodogorgon sp. TaxID=2485824 RepID=A0A3G3MHZ0_9FLOR|nr:ribosomal protein L24 [Rhodogorgon sp.]